MTYADGEPVSALPLEYLERWEAQNLLFGDTADFEGVMETPSGLSLVVSQRWITGDVPTEDEIDNLMWSAGFESTNLTECYFRRSDNLAVMDCHDGNFVKIDDGLVIPIDVIVVKADEGLLQKMGVAS